MEVNRRNLDNKGDAIKADVGTPVPSSLSFLPGHHEVYRFPSCFCHDVLPHHMTTSNGNKHPWTETYETMNQNKSFFF
jgi:hypothetical protein